MSEQSTINELHALYQECVNCPNTEKECPGIWRDSAKGIIPDGFYFKTTPVDVLVVEKKYRSSRSTRTRIIYWANRRNLVQDLAG